MLNKVFVYGSLMSGMINHHIIRPYTYSKQPATVTGVVYQLPSGYPAYKYCKTGMVSGELVQLTDDPAALISLDRLEDYHGPRNNFNLYERVTRRATLTDGRVVEAFIYEWACPEELDRIGILVPDGNWRKYLT